MGTTATNLHVLHPRRGAVSLPEEVERAYGRLGYRKPQKADPGPAKKVIVASPGAGGFVTIRDGDNDAIDTGELKDLAVALSKRLETVAILTSVYDSDNFEFIVWRAGKQVDAAVDDESRQGDLKIAKGARRIKLWHEMFLERDGNGPSVNGARAKISDGLAFWGAKLHSAEVETASPFAEDRLLRWCAAAGVDGAAALARMANGPPPDATILELIRTPPPPKAPPVRDAAPLLAVAREDEELPYHRFFPAAWP